MTETTIGRPCQLRFDAGIRNPLTHSPMARCPPRQPRIIIFEGGRKAGYCQSGYRCNSSTGNGSGDCPHGLPILVLQPINRRFQCAAEPAANLRVDYAQVGLRY